MDVSRAAETAAVVAAAAMTLAAVAVPLATRAGLPARVVVGLIAVAASLAAAIRSVRGRSTAAGVAARVDRTFGWDDLLATAFATTGSADPFAAAVRAAADARCRAVRPSDVPVARLGRGAWSAVLATLIVASAVMLVRLRPRPSDAGRTDPANLLALTADPPVNRPPPAASSDGHLRRTGADPTDQSGSPRANEEASSGLAAEHSPVSRKGGGTGRGRGETAVPRLPAVDPAAASWAADHVAGGTTAAGGGPAGRPALAGRDGATGLTAAAGTDAAVPPWRSSDWAAARRSAAAAVTAGTVPAVDRDLVRDYFDPALVTR